MVEIDGSQYSGSGTIVRQAVAFSALTGQPVHIVNARSRRPKPGLRHQHIRVVQAIGELVNGTAEGLSPGSQEIVFRPGTLRTGRHYLWDIGTAGSTTMLGLGILPVLAFASSSVNVELRGGLFQDCAPSVFHLQHVLLPLLHCMGLEVELVMERPGYVPRGEGIVRLTVQPVRKQLRQLRIVDPGTVTRLWGVALSSHLEKRHVSERMADAAQEVLGSAGHKADIDVQYDQASLQPGAVLALFADLGEGVRLGADQAGALRRTAEFIGQHVAKQLLEDMKAGATLDRFASDQIIPFASLAEGESRFRIAAVTDHVLANLWLAEKFLGVTGRLNDHTLSITGVGFPRQGLDA
ncbi:MAG: RNA 3'-terminal-phosphate cyclase [Nitrospirae bacterium RBG_19FT_COMBO_58_9]|nr:MAG: RNA 3'-terminal-phosphate cyclase [Nitrospirae bacterium RBG_19FT_COMBO_58_9]